MKKSVTLLLSLLSLLCSRQCYSQQPIPVRKIVLNENDPFSGSYIVAEPKDDSIVGALVLIAGFSQQAEDIFPETKLEDVATQQHILTVGFAAGHKLYADSITRANLTSVIKDVMARYGIKPQQFLIGGFSAGGMIALRYVELCKQYPDKFPIQPPGVFMVDSPIDLFTMWDNLAKIYADKYSAPAVDEAERAMAVMRHELGVPTENISKYAELTAFSMNKQYSENEQWLKGTAVRAYHDVDIAWRLINRRQTVHNSNYEVTAELINRLLLMGNEKAEFMQTFKTGYRANGQRHPHSWSIVDEVELIQWMQALIH